MRPCLVSSLLDQRIRSPLVGLSKNELRIMLKSSYFVCCNGEGRQITPDREVRVCQLRSRLAKLQAILDLFISRWGAEHSNIFHGMIKTVDLKKLSSIKNNPYTRGRAIVSKDRSTPSYLWLVAVAAAWRFGHNVHFTTLREKNTSSLLPPHPLPNTVIMVENQRSPWHPENAFDCETIISYCYNTVTPLWIDFVAEETKQFKRDAVTVRVQNKVDRLRAKNPLEHLSRSSQEKLQEMLSS